MFPSQFYIKLRLFVHIAHDLSGRKTPLLLHITNLKKSSHSHWENRLVENRHVIKINQSKQSSVSMIRVGRVRKILNLGCLWNEISLYLFYSNYNFLFLFKFACTNLQITQNRSTISYNLNGCFTPVLKNTQLVTTTFSSPSKRVRGPFLEKIPVTFRTRKAVFCLPRFHSRSTFQ